MLDSRENAYGYEDSKELSEVEISFTDLVSRADIHATTPNFDTESEEDRGMTDEFLDNMSMPSISMHRKRHANQTLLSKQSSINLAWEVHSGLELKNITEVKLK